jgi:ZIP family zinc transporter
LLGVARRRLSPDTRFLGRSGPGARTSALVFLVLFVHSLPEGFAVGTAFASDRAGLSLFVILAIAIQNIPEGTSVAIPMAASGFSRTRQFWAAVATSAPQPVGALVAFLLVEQVETLLPVSFAFAAGAMLALIVVELLPKAYAGPGRSGPSVGIASGAAVMLALSFALGV